MKKIRSFFRSAMGTTFMFMLAILLLMTGTIGGVRATPQIFNPDFYYGGLELDEIGITLLENGLPVSSRNYNRTKQAFDVASNDTDPNKQDQGILLAGMLGNNKLKIGYAYPERLSVENSKIIPEYVRVTVYKYWVDGQGKRFRVFDKQGNDMMINDLIELHFLTDKGWTIDDHATTAERTVLYYHNALAPGDKVDFADTLRIDNSILDYGMKVPAPPTNNTETSWEWKWAVDGLQFVIEAEADGVQNHNARAAVKSAWGLTEADITRLGLNLPE